MLADVLRRGARKQLGLLKADIVANSNYERVIGYQNQRSLDRTSNGVLWAFFSTAAGGVHYSAYSVDNGVTWSAPQQIAALNNTTYTFNATIAAFIDIDDYAHVVLRSHSDKKPYYIRGTPNAARTSYTWTTPLLVVNDPTFGDYDIVAHREGTGWVAHIVGATDMSGTLSNVAYFRVRITSAAVITIETTGYSAPIATLFAPQPCIAFRHNGDGKTVASNGKADFWIAAGARSDITGGGGGSGGIRFMAFKYSAGAWTPVTANYLGVAEPNHGLGDPALGSWMNLLFDGKKFMIGGFWASTTTTDLMLLEFDPDDVSYVPISRTLLTGPAAADQLNSGAMTCDAVRNIWFFGSDTTGTASTRKLNRRKWNRVANALGPIVTIENGVDIDHSIHPKRLCSRNRIEYLFMDTGTSWAVRFEGADA